MEKLISDFSLGLFVWQTVLFLGLLFLLRKFAWGPTLRALNQREEFISNSIDEAKAAEKKTKELLEQNQSLLQEGYAERDLMMKEARETKDKIVREAVDEAKAAADKVMVKAREEIKNEKAKAIEELKDQVSAISFDIASKVLKEKMSDADMQKDSIQGALKEISFN